MADERLARVVSKLQNLPSISLPTDYPRPSGSHKLVEAAHNADLSEQTCISLLKLTLYDETEGQNNNDSEDEDGEQIASKRPSGFHLLLAAFTVLLHRYTGDTDLVIGSSSAYKQDPVVLRFPVDPQDPFWAVVRRVQHVEREADADAVPFSTLVHALSNSTSEEASRPLFRVRFFDETDIPEDVEESSFIRSTSLTSDLTVFVTRPPISTRATLSPRISLRILYNSLLFTSARISTIVDQLSVFLRKVSTNPILPVGSVPLLTPSQRTALPDPTGDLNWCDFKGAITDIFSRNARTHPERPCVIQSIPSPTPHLSSPQDQEKRAYSYGIIRHASNILAHHLLKAGVKREEVVMVYAHRSVELVVAVMAVLKIGATFSVIGTSLFPFPSSFIFMLS